MSKVHLAPADIQTGLPIGGGETPPVHPTQPDVATFYSSIERYLEYNQHHVGDVLCYWKAIDYTDAFSDRSLPYGTFCIRGGYSLRHGGYIVVTGDCEWRWIKDEAGEIFTGLPNLLKNHHP